MCAQYVLNQGQKEALNLLSGMTSASTLQEREKNLIAQLLADCVVDSLLNEAVRGHLRNVQLPAQPPVDIFKLVFNARQWENFNTIYAQFSEKFTAISKGEKLGEEQPLRDVLHHYAIIRSAANLLHDFDRLQEKGLLANHPELMELHQKIKKCHDMVEVLEKKFAAEMPSKLGLFAHDEHASLFQYYQSMKVVFNAGDKQEQQFRPK